MTNNPKKHVIDAFLREIYGDKSPPDQSEEILRRLEENDSTLISDSYSVASQPVPDATPLDDSGPMPVVVTKPQNNAMAKRLHWLTITASVLVLAGILGLVIKLANSPVDNRPTAEKQSKESLPDRNQDLELAKDTKQPGTPDVTKPTTDRLANNSLKNRQPEIEIPEPQNLRPAAPVNPPTTQFAEGEVPSDTSDVLELVNSTMNRNWHVNVISVTPRIDNQMWFRQAFEKLMGRPVTSQELKQFDLPDLSKLENRIAVMDQLLNSDLWNRELAHAWADRFMIHLTDGVLNGDAWQDSNHSGLRIQLRAAFESGQPLNEVVAELLTATGSTDPQATEFNGAAGWLATLGNADRSTVQVSRALLGTEVQCAQCHSDSLHRQSRGDFLGLNAFLKGLRVDRSTGVPVVSDIPTRRENPGLFYEDDQGLAVYAPPKIAGNPWRLRQDQTRADLADGVVSSDRFAMAMVNWVWKEIYGYGLVRDGRAMNVANSPHHQLLEQLAAQWVAHDFDFRVIAKWAVLSDPFFRSDQPSNELLVKDIPAYGGVPFFSYVYSRRNVDSKSALDRLVAAYQAPDGLSLHDRLELTAKEVDLGLPQRPVPNKNGVNSPRVEKIEIKPSDLNQARSPLDQPFSDEDAPDFAKGWGVDASMNRTLDAIADSAKLSFDEKLDHIYQLALKRSPNSGEIRRVKLLQSSPSHPGDRKALQDVWWAIYPR